MLSKNLQIRVSDIENVTNFYGFYKALMLKSLRSELFFELADNGMLSCIPVVAVNSRKWGRFGGLVRGSVPCD